MRLEARRTMPVLRYKEPKFVGTCSKDFLRNEILVESVVSMCVVGFFLRILAADNET